MSISVHRKIIRWIYNFPFTDWIPVELTGKWKITTIGRITTLYLEVVQKERSWFFSKPKETTMWVDEDDLRVIEEFINECGNSNG